MTPKRLALTAVLIAALLAGCSGTAEKISPQVAVRDAARSTASAREATYTLSVAGSEADMNALFNDGAPLSAEDREGLALLRNGHIALATAAGRFGLDVKAGDLEHAVELRVIDKKLYARADVAGLAKLFKASPEEINQTVAALAGRDGFGFLAAAVQGRWLVADFSQLGGIFEQMAGQLGVKTPAGTADPNAAKAEASARLKPLKDAIGKALSDDAAIAKLKSDAVGDHYRATVSSLRDFYAKVRPAFAAQLGSLPMANGLPAVEAVPDKPASMDVWIKSGRVVRLEVPLAQLSPNPKTDAGPVALRLDIYRSAPSLAAPADAVNVDVMGLLGSFFKELTGGLGQIPALKGITG
ncbi:MAG TPA: hypothetical protein VHL53_20860 [Acidimicrobiia bacterium]|nr:hypothetical protein [Acidimicrobiia bacterium]